MMRALLATIRGLTMTLMLSALILSKPALAQEFTVNLKDTDIQEFIEFGGKILVLSSEGGE